MSTLAVNVLENLSGDAIGTITLGTEQASTSGTSIDFTSIPSGVRRITVMFVDVSGDGSSDFMIQLGDSGGIEATGYASSSSGVNATAQSGDSYTTGFGIENNSAGTTWNGSIVLSLEDASGFTWVAHGVVAGTSGTSTYIVGGSKSLSAELTQIRITSESGAINFDAGAINIQYEI